MRARSRYALAPRAARRAATAQPRVAVAPGAIALAACPSLALAVFFKERAVQQGVSFDSLWRR